MIEFWKNALGPSHRLLVPQGLRRMWQAVWPRAERGYRINPTVATWYTIAPADWYHVPWDALQGGKLPPRYRYRHFTQPKRDGTLRQITEPGVDLKRLQYGILQAYLENQRPHHAAIGYRRGCSIVDHAAEHAGARTIITADIENFFPSSTRYRVRQYWKTHPFGFNDPQVMLLTNLTTYRGSLPQGAPTSPVLSNLINKTLDHRLSLAATQCGGTYTRYADDIAFSWRMRARPPSDFESMVRRILREYGYRLHSQKGWQVWGRADEPEITGVVLTRRGGLDIPATLKRRMQALAASDDEADQLRLAGYEGYRQMITDHS